jgi:hypothetical protein
MARRWGYLLIPLFIVFAWFGASSLKDHLDPNAHKSDEENEDARWIATSKNFLDRNACRWIAICGLAHYHPEPAGVPWRRKLELNVGEEQPVTKTEKNTENAWWEEAPRDRRRLKPEDFTGDDRVLKEVPQYVLDAAPLIHLYSKEEFWPSHITEHLKHMAPYHNHTAIHTNISHTVHNLDQLNDGPELRKGKFLFLKSKEDVEFRPKWLASAYNKPNPYEDEDEDEDEDEEGELDADTKFTDMDVDTADARKWYDPSDPSRPDIKIAPPVSPLSRNRPQKQELRRRQALKHKPDASGYSPAPAILILVDKGHGIIDAFWFYFYSYNLGTTVLNIRFGNHVGDWEHSLVRFHDGVPKAVFFSAHSGGTAFSFDSVEKGKGEGREGRPVLYSAFGSHAMYAMPGSHPYVLPFGILADVTDKGPMWDPALNYLAYHYSTPITHDVDAKLAPEPFLETHLSLRDNKDEDIFSVMERKETLVPAASNPNAPTNWFWFNGHWGDKFYELGDERQWRFVGQYHYVNGPLGPRYKNLGRSKVCQSGLTCRILDSINDGRSWIARRR